MSVINQYSCYFDKRIINIIFMCTWKCSKDKGTEKKGHDFKEQMHHRFMSFICIIKNIS